MLWFILSLCCWFVILDLVYALGWIIMLFVCVLFSLLGCGFGWLVDCLLCLRFLSLGLMFVVDFGIMIWCLLFGFECCGYLYFGFIIF